jgi:hypothetical protein
LSRGELVTYLEAGLSLRYLFPRTEQGGNIYCHAELDLVGGDSEEWRERNGMCNEPSSTEEIFQRHVKTKHIKATRAPLARIVASGELKVHFLREFV